jgi:hypothetical protein
MMVLGIEIPDVLEFDRRTGDLVKQTDLPFDVVMRLVDNTPCEVVLGDRLCGERIMASAARWSGFRDDGQQDEFDLTGGWRCKAGHGPKQLAASVAREGDVR